MPNLTFHRLPHSSPLPPKIKKYSTEFSNHLARNRVSYIKVLALGNLDLY